MRIAVLVPCYNEAATITKVVSDFRNALPDATVYVYDNNSKDGTAELAKKAGAVVVSEYRQGKGFVVRSMFRDIDADCYVMIDGDDTYFADDVAAMIAPVLDGTADMVVGDRLSTTYFAENDRPLHGVGNKLVRFLVNRIFSADIHDVMTGYRAFSRRFVKSFPVLSGGFEIETEMTIHALDKDFLVREIPIHYQDRTEGSESKLDTLPDGMRVLKTVAALFKDYRPLAFFGSAAAIASIIGLGMFLAPLEEYLATGFVSKVPTLMVSVGFMIGALLALLCAVILDSLRKQSRMFYELALTAQAEADRVRAKAGE